MKPDELQLLSKQKKDFEEFYFKHNTLYTIDNKAKSVSEPKDLFKTNSIKKQIKEEVKKEINLKSVDFKEIENQGVKLTVTEKIN